MAISDHARTNFNTLLRADDGDYAMTPLGHLADGNPYDAYLPPDPDDPTGFIPNCEDGGAA